MKTRLILSICFMCCTFLAMGTSADKSETITVSYSWRMINDAPGLYPADGVQSHVVMMLVSDKVPPQVLRQFEKSFVYDDEGYFIGAQVDMLWPYLSNREIMQLIEPLISGKDIAYEGYKPKSPRGCKKNNRWVCVLRGIDETH